MILREYFKKSHFKLSYQDLLMLFIDISNQKITSKTNAPISFSLDNIEVSSDKRKINKKHFSFTGTSAYKSNHSQEHSLVMLVIYCLTGNKPMDNYEKSLEPIYGTKLYWALKRAMKQKISLII